AKRIATHAAPRIKGRVTKLIIMLAFLRIRQNLVSFVNFFEFLLSLLFFVRIFVGMPLQSLLPVGGFNLLIGSRLLNCQNIVIITFGRHNNRLIVATCKTKAICLLVHDVTFFNFAVRFFTFFLIGVGSASFVGFAIRPGSCTSLSLG